MHACASGLLGYLIFSDALRSDMGHEVSSGVIFSSMVMHGAVLLLLLPLPKGSACLSDVFCCMFCPGVAMAGMGRSCLHCICSAGLPSRGAHGTCHPVHEAA